MRASAVDRVGQRFEMLGGDAILQEDDGLLATVAIALIEDMDTPFAGIIVVSPEPMQAALARINSP
jgi:hypothetical protein